MNQAIDDQEKVLVGKQEDVSIQKRAIPAWLNRGNEDQGNMVNTYQDNDIDDDAAAFLHILDEYYTAPDTYEERDCVFEDEKEEGSDENYASLLHVLDEYYTAPDTCGQRVYSFVYEKEVESDSSGDIFAKGLIEVASNSNSSTDTDPVSSPSAIDYNTDIQLKIFSFLPAKAVFRIKCVSQEIRRSVEKPQFGYEHFQQLASISRVTGFLYQCDSNKVTNLWWPIYHISDHTFEQKKRFADTGGLPDCSLSFLQEDRLKDYVTLIDSCNGLLLCRVTNMETRSIRLYVCNPLTMEKVIVPQPLGNKKQPCTGNELLDFVEVFALISRSSPTGYLYYEVLHLYRGPDTETMGDTELRIYSSETCKWEEVSKSLPYLCHGRTTKGSKVIVKNTLYWNCLADYMLVYCFSNTHDKKTSLFKTVDLLETPPDYYYMLETHHCSRLSGLYLWDYNGELVCSYEHYSDANKHPVWRLNYCKKTQQFDWELKDLSQQLGDLNKHIGNGQSYRILDYNPTLETMYLSINTRIMSYGINERSLDTVFEILENEIPAYGLTRNNAYIGNHLVPYVYNLQRLIDTSV